MKLMEVIGVYSFFAVIVSCLHHYSFWMFDFSVESMNKFMHVDSHTGWTLKFMQPECLTNRAIIHKWGGAVIDWIECELIFHLTYVFTFVLLMIKSRLMTVGMDHT